MDNSFGSVFRITSFGESHGDLIGIVIDGVPAGMEFDLKFIQNEIDRRKPGKTHLTSPRLEEDRVQLLSGVFENKTTGAPLCLIIENKDVDSSIYEKYRDFLRPSHIDYPALKKYHGFSDLRGSGRFSGRITAGFVMAGAIAKQILMKYKVMIFAYTKSIGEIIDNYDYSSYDLNELVNLREKSLIGAINPEKSKSMELLIERVKKQMDSVGGIVKCIVINFPAGKGGPIFNSIESNISKAMFAIPAIKAIEFGVGFKATKMKGSEHNDPWTIKNGKVQTTKNDAGGIIGGISTGMPIEFAVAVKPTASIGIPQKTVDIKKMEEVRIEFLGRHDPCIVPRVIPVVEAMTANVLLDILLLEGFIPRVLKT
ncbi:MAG: chorismate synthase [Candidatus Odinarchaeota archaeon]